MAPSSALKTSMWATLGVSASALLLWGLVSLASGSHPDQPAPVSHQEALGVLRRAVDMVQSGRSSALCEALGAAEHFCFTWLVEEGLALSAPLVEPAVVASHTISAQPGYPMGRVLVLEGVDGHGNPFRTDFLVVRTFGAAGGRLAAPYPIYWRGTKVLPNGAAQP